MCPAIRDSLVFITKNSFTESRCKFSMGTDLAISSPLADLTDTLSFTNVKSLAWTLIVPVALIQFTCNTNLLLVFEHYLTMKSTIPGSRPPTHDIGYIVQWEVHQRFKHFAKLPTICVNWELLYLFKQTQYTRYSQGICATTSLGLAVGLSLRSPNHLYSTTYSPRGIACNKI